MAEDRIEREIVVAAPQGRVWEIITQAEHVGKWFGESAEIDLRPGGTMVLRWEKYGTVYATIERIEQPNYFSYRWMPGLIGEKPRAEHTTLVEFTLTPQGDETRVRVVETGFSRLPVDADKRAEHLEGNTEGWESELSELKQYLEQLPV